MAPFVSGSINARDLAVGMILASLSVRTTTVSFVWGDKIWAYWMLAESHSHFSSYYTTVVVLVSEAEETAEVTCIRR